jgi:hypothetical protein
MATEYDTTEFVDTDFQAHKSPYTTTPFRAPSREEVDSKVSETQQKLAELKRAQEELERERSALEEVRRRQAEFQTGRGEMIQNLTRGLGLLEEAEFNARRDAEQMAKSIADLRDGLAKVQSIHEEGWTKDNFSVELTRALTTLENARLEWNGARLKYPVLSGEAVVRPGASASSPAAAPLITPQKFGELCRMGFAFTWPLAAVALLALGVLVAILLRH